MNKGECIKIMNRLGNEKQPFLFIVDFEMENCFVGSSLQAAKEGIYFDFNGIRNYNNAELDMVKIKLDKTPVSFETYQKAFTYVQNQLKIGNSYLVNLTFPTTIKSTHSLFSIFHSAIAKYLLYYKDQFVVFSPESFVKINNGEISTFPMKGTIDADVQNAHGKLLSNKKEIAEHATIVDLLRNDLSKVATNVNVKKYRYVEEINTLEKKLLQVSSEICGTLTDDFKKNIGSLIFELLPAGSVSGAPKKKTLDIIKKVESYKRGFYTGVAGYFDGQNLDSCVLIRFIEQINGELIYKSGGGITAQSEAIEEYQELIDKIYVPIS